MCKKRWFFYRSKFFEFFGSCFDSCLLIFEKRIALLTGSHGLSRGGLHSNANSRPENLSDRKCICFAPAPLSVKKNSSQSSPWRRNSVELVSLLLTCRVDAEQRKGKLATQFPLPLTFPRTRQRPNWSSSTLGIAEPVNGQTPLLQKVQVVTWDDPLLPRTLVANKSEQNCLFSGWRPIRPNTFWRSIDNAKQCQCTFNLRGPSYSCRSITLMSKRVVCYHSQKCTSI